MNVFLKSAYILLVLAANGCASLSSAPHACEESLPLIYPGMQKFTGNVFQIGDCSVSKILRIETGSFYSKNKTRINEELDGKWDNYRYLNYFAELFDCKSEDTAAFRDFLLVHRLEIFGTEDAPVEPRQVMLNINHLLGLDINLSNKCI